MISTRDLTIESGHYARMGDQECQKIHMATLEILERTGVDVHDEKARQILEQGCSDCLNILDHRTGKRRRPVFPMWWKLPK